jgi:hypothetical protein
MSGTLKINPGLLAALEHYSAHRYDPNQPHYFRHTEVLPDGRGHQTDWSIERTAALAHRILDEEPLMLLKFEKLRRGLELYGMWSLYEKIMGEPMTRSGAL